jgi:multidrug efflux pump
MLSRFFIDRPIFAWVIAIITMIAGTVSVVNLPIRQYPAIAPPSVGINVNYPGASAQTVQDTVIQVIEQALNGIDNLTYITSEANSDGSATITLTFAQGTVPDTAQVQVQNKLQTAMPLLPQEVQQSGIRVNKPARNFLVVMGFISTDGSMNNEDLADFVATNVLDPLNRTPGVGDVTMFASQYAMRIWIDPAKLVGFGLTTSDINAAIRAQNAQVSAGTMGDLPLVAGQGISANIVVSGQLTSVDEFGDIVLRANTDGSSVRLKDVARIELGGQNYATSARLNGKPSTGIGVQLSPTGNALATADLVRARMGELARYFPQGVKWDIPYDASRFVKISITQVVETLVEAVILVFLVMYLFLQSFRYTLIPTIVVPVALMGAFGMMFALGYSINVLTMFAMVLAVGILVDDAIVVVENVERIMSEEGLSPREATKKAMSQIVAAIVGITVTLVSVFVPMAFFGGAVGNIYRQFSLVMVSSMLFSAFLAQSLTPALCATLLKPVEAGHHHEKRGFFGWFNRGFSRTAKNYEGWVARILKRTGRFMIVFALIIGVVTLMFMRLPSSFLPNEDQGFMIVNVQLPPGATQGRTLGVMEKMENYMLAQPEVKAMVSVLGFSFSGSGQNAGLAFVTLKDWDEREGPEHSASGIAQRALAGLSGIRDAIIFPLSPPPIRELGNATGFNFRLQDRGGNGHDALVAARNQLLGLAG